MIYKSLNIGDEVIIEPSVWHKGANIGERLGVVRDTSSYILVDIYDYNDNPVKCLRHEVKEVDEKLKEVLALFN